MTPDEVRKMDNKKCLIFIRGFDPVLDNKYNPFGHPMFSQTADGDGVPYVHKPATEGGTIGPGFTILNEKALAYYEGLKEKGEPVYIDEIPYEDFMLLGQVDMEKRFMDLDEQEKRDRLNEEMVPELEYAFDMENETGGTLMAGQAEMPEYPAEKKAEMPQNSGTDNGVVPEGFVIGGAGMPETFVSQSAEKKKTVMSEESRKPAEKPDNRKQQSKSRKDRAEDSISYRLFHWKFTVEQKEEVKRAMALRVPKEVILSYFYPETSVVRMMEIRSRYE